MGCPKEKLPQPSPWNTTPALPFPFPLLQAPGSPGPRFFFRLSSPKGWGLYKQCPPEAKRAKPLNRDPKENGRNCHLQKSLSPHRERNPDWGGGHKSFPFGGGGRKYPKIGGIFFDPLMHPISPSPSKNKKKKTRPPPLQSFLGGGFFLAPPAPRFPPFCRGPTRCFFFFPPASFNQRPRQFIFPHPMFPELSPFFDDQKMKTGSTGFLRVFRLGEKILRLGFPQPPRHTSPFFFVPVPPTGGPPPPPPGPPRETRIKGPPRRVFGHSEPLSPPPWRILKKKRTPPWAQKPPWGRAPAPGKAGLAGPSPPERPGLPHKAPAESGFRVLVCSAPAGAGACPRRGKGPGAAT